MAAPSRRLTASLLGAGALVIGAALTLGAGGAIVAATAGLIGVAARHDNHTGSLLMLAVLVTVVVGILFGLVAMMAIGGR